MSSASNDGPASNAPGPAGEPTDAPPVPPDEPTGAALLHGDSFVLTDRGFRRASVISSEGGGACAVWDGTGFRRAVVSGRGGPLPDGGAASTVSLTDGAEASVYGPACLFLPALAAPGRDGRKAVSVHAIAGRRGVKLARTPLPPFGAAGGPPAPGWMPSSPFAWGCFSAVGSNCPETGDNLVDLRLLPEEGGARGRFAKELGLPRGAAGRVNVSERLLRVRRDLVPLSAPEPARFGWLAGLLAAVPGRLGGRGLGDDGHLVMKSTDGAWLRELRLLLASVGAHSAVGGGELRVPASSAYPLQERASALYGVAYAAVDRLRSDRGAGGRLRPLRGAEPRAVELAEDPVRVSGVAAEPVEAGASAAWYGVTSEDNAPVTLVVDGMLLRL